jgi:hypothetical protein
MFFSFSQRVFDELYRITFGFRLSVKAFSGFRQDGGNSLATDRRSVRRKKSAKYFRFCWQIVFSAAARGSTAVLELLRLPRQITRPYRPVA